MHNFLICFFCTAHISSEPVFIQLFVGLNVPQTAGIRRNFICQNDRAISQTTKFNLEVNQTDTNLQEEFLQYFVYLAV